MSGSLPKVLIVSFDGGVWSNLIPLANAGIMPNLKKLLDESIHGNLESTIPPVTPPAWTAFMTGCNPGKTGVFDFYELQEKSYKLSLTTSKSIQVDTLWKILSDNGSRVGIVDVPINYPPQPVNGFMISGWERPNNKKVFTYPPDLGAKLIEKLGDYPICLTTFDRQGVNDIDYLNSLIKITSKVGDAALWLLDTESVDFFMVHFQTTDIIQHGFWNEIATFDFTSKDPVLQKIWDYYRNLDAYFGKIKSKTPSDGNFFLVSDHGFGGVKRRMAINVWLKENGYLKLKEDFSTKLRTQVKGTAIKVANKIDILARLKNRIKRKAQENLDQRIIVPKDFDPINYSETRAFSNIGTMYGTIQINTIGREVEGMVSPEEVEKLKSEIIEKLVNIRDPLLGKPFIKKVVRKEEIYTGQALNKIPDLILIPNEGFYFFQGTKENELFHDAHELSEGNHIMEGIVAISSPFNRTIDLSNAKITDITPTILNIFKINIPAHIDGKSLFSTEKISV